jgi:hypothetical protein
LLLISGSAVPADGAELVGRAPRQRLHPQQRIAELTQFEGRGHALTIDRDWQDVADACLEWLAKEGL